MSGASSQSWEVLMKTGDVTRVEGVTKVSRGEFGDTLDLMAEDGLKFTAPIVAIAYAQRIEATR